MKLGNIKVLIGPNNAGKSSILRAVSLLQKGSSATLADIRSGAPKAEIIIACDDLEPKAGETSLHDRLVGDEYTAIV